jgi:hypothetical protein
MDKIEKQRRFDWLPEQMPGVVKLVKEKRALLGNAHVNECWKRGVVKGEPGWFFAREGVLAIGTPWNEPAMANFAALQVTATQALLVLRDPEVAHGAHP